MNFKCAIRFRQLILVRLHCTRNRGIVKAANGLFHVKDNFTVTRSSYHPGDTWKRQLFFVYLPGMGVDIGVRFRHNMNSKKHVDVNLETSLPYHKLSCTVALIPHNFYFLSKADFLLFKKWREAPLSVHRRFVVIQFST